MGRSRQRWSCLWATARACPTPSTSSRCRRRSQRRPAARRDRHRVLWKQKLQEDLDRDEYYYQRIRAPGACEYLRMQVRYVCLHVCTSLHVCVSVCPFTPRLCATRTKSAVCCCSFSLSLLLSFLACSTSCPLTPRLRCHTYTINWSPSEISFFVDRHPIRAHQARKGRPWPAKPLQLIVSGEEGMLGSSCQPKMPGMLQTLPTSHCTAAAETCTVQYQYCTVMYYTVS